MIFAIVFLLITSIYLFQVLRYFIGLFRLKSGTNRQQYTISIIIPARNEEGVIGDCLSALLAQTYPNNKFEIIIVNDNSQDNTESMVREFKAVCKNIQLLNLREEQHNIAPKKHAISQGIQMSHNDLIFTTDADCIAEPNWLQSMVSHFEDDVGPVTGLVIFDKQKERTLFHKIQSLEFLSLIIAGAGSIGSDMPVIGNGANLAYRRSVFSEVHGFRGIDDLKSGDDDLFIQKVARTTHWQIRCASEKAAVVSTSPVPELKSFFNQRIRWASKGIHYHNPLFISYLISVYLFYLILLATLPYSIFHLNTFPHPVIAFVLKIFIDFLLLYKGTHIVDRRDLLKYFLLAELFQIPYILIVGFIGLRGKYKWKGR